MLNKKAGLGDALSNPIAIFILFFIMVLFGILFFVADGADLDIVLTDSDISTSNIALNLMKSTNDKNIQFSDLFVLAHNSLDFKETRHKNYQTIEENQDSCDLKKECTYLKIEISKIMNNLSNKKNQIWAIETYQEPGNNFLPELSFISKDYAALANILQVDAPEDTTYTMVSPASSFETTQIGYTTAQIKQIYFKENDLHQAATSIPLNKGGTLKLYIWYID